MDEYSKLILEDTILLEGLFKKYTPINSKDKATINKVLKIAVAKFKEKHPNCTYPKSLNACSDYIKNQFREIFVPEYPNVGNNKKEVRRIVKVDGAIVVYYDRISKDKELSGDDIALLPGAFIIYTNEQGKDSMKNLGCLAIIKDMQNK